jgi:hypothetical protein
MEIRGGGGEESWGWEEKISKFKDYDYYFLQNYDI